MKKDKSSLSNKEYIKKVFAEDGIKAPASLSEDRVMDMLNSEDKKAEAKKKKYKEAKRRPLLLKAVAIAACALVSIIGISGLYYSGSFAPNTVTADGTLYEFKSEAEIKQLLFKTDESSRAEYLPFKLGRSDDDILYESEMAAGFESDDASSKSGTITTGNSDYSETYLQVENVDEADIVKTDGRCIYFVDNKREVVIYEVKDEKTEKLSTIGNTGTENYIEKIFLKGDTLVTVGHVYENDEDFTAVVTYDISDRRDPKLLSVFRQSGLDIVAARMVGDYVYLVSNTYAYEGHEIPKFSLNGELKTMDCSDISCVPNPTRSSYLILSAVDISSGAGAKSKTKAVFGATQEVYCNDRNLYCAISEWDDKSDSESTRIVRASLDGLKIKFNKTVSVRGYINNQFSMDENNAHFRIATTSERGGMNVNNLFVMDEKLEETGSITGFARNESIKAVRFMGDKAYVITYEAIDPLFVIDLKDPSNPRIEGEVKIDGFSSMLIPIDKNRLLGIGHATGDNGYGGQYDSGLKLALFDISNPSKPKILDSKEFENMSSPAQDTHLALTVNESKGYYAIPYDIYNNDLIITDDAEVITEESGEPETEYGVLVFGTEDEKSKADASIKVYDQHRLAKRQILRSPYVGDYVYGLDGYGDIYSFKPSIK